MPLAARQVPTASVRLRRTASHRSCVEFIERGWHSRVGSWRSVHEGPFTTIQGLLLTLVLPFTVLWLPLLNSPGLGNLTILDCVLLLLWGTTLLQLVTKSRKSSGEDRALRTAVYAFAPAVFGVVGALLLDSQSRLTTEILQHAKRFGLLSIIPLAISKNPAVGAIHFAWSLLTGPGTKFAGRVWNRFLMIIGSRRVIRIDGLVNMVEASHALTHYLKENGRSFAKSTLRHDRLFACTQR